jgi:hypothetical protein
MLGGGFHFFFCFQWLAGLLVLDEPHYPACDDGAADEEGETEGTEANHHTGFGALGDAEDDGGEEREEQDCSAV